MNNYRHYLKSLRCLKSCRNFNLCYVFISILVIYLSPLNLLDFLREPSTSTLPCGEPNIKDFGSRNEPLHPRRLDVSSMKYLITPDACGNNRDTKYLVYTHTATTHFQQRMNLRKSWLNQSLYEPNFLQHFFIFGRHSSRSPQIEARVYAEAAKFKDVLYVDFTDVYYNLTHKNAFAIRYVSSCCRRSKYILKTDDDIVINIPTLDRYVSKFSPASFGLLCVLFVGGHVIRDPLDTSSDAKHYLGEEDYPLRKPDHFPAYCSGCGIVMTFPLMHALYRRLAHEPYVRVDDVYFTGTLTEHIKQPINKVDVPKAESYDEAMTALASPGGASGSFFFRQLGDTEHYFQVWKKLRELQEENTIKRDKLQRLIDKKFDEMG